MMCNHLATAIYYSTHYSLISTMLLGKGCFWKRTVLEKDDFRKECIKKYGKCGKSYVEKKMGGTKVLWGTKVLRRTKVLQGTKVLWGTKVWGTNIRLGTKVRGNKSLMGNESPLGNKNRGTKV